MKIFCKIVTDILHILGIYFVCKLYLVLDEKVAVFDTVDQEFTLEWLNNLEQNLNGRDVDYLIIQHMEPDHSANIMNFVAKYPNAYLVFPPVGNGLFNSSLYAL